MACKYKYKDNLYSKEDLEIELLFEKIDNLKDYKSQELSNFEQQLELLKQHQDNNGVIAFPKDGIKTNSEVQEYVSKRLYEELDYLDPSATKFPEIKDIVEKTQGISDKEIEDKIKRTCST